MFVTTPDMEHWVPSGLAGGGSRFWQAFALGSELPWFLLTLKRREGRARVVQTMAVAWDSRLQLLIQEARAENVASICRVSPDGTAMNRWRCDDVLQVWAVASAEVADERGGLLFALEGAVGLIDAFGSPAEVALGDRRLLFSAH